MCVCGVRHKQQVETTVMKIAFTKRTYLICICAYENAVMLKGELRQDFSLLNA